MITGICIPCVDLQHAASVAQGYPLGGNVLKVGKNHSQWYCVVVYNQGA